MSLQELVRAWQITASFHSFNPPATERDLEKVELELGFHLPVPLRELYLFSNGMHLLRGNLNIYPLLPENGKRALSNASIQCRELFQIPPEVLVFGDNGSDEHYGIWNTEIKSEIFKHPILEIGELFVDPDCMTVVATDLSPFLYGTTAFYILSSAGSNEALDVIGLPQEIRTGKDVSSNEHFSYIRKWIDPLLPDPDPEPYTKGLDTAQIKKLFAK